MCMHYFVGLDMIDTKKFPVVYIGISLNISTSSVNDYELQHENP